MWLTVYKDYVHLLAIWICKGVPLDYYFGLHVQRRVHSFIHSCMDIKFLFVSLLVTKIEEVGLLLI